MSSPTLPHVFLWPDRVHGPFSVTLHWALVSDRTRMEVVGVDLRSFPAAESPGRSVEPPGGFHRVPVTTTLLRQVAVSALAAEKRRTFAEVLPKPVGDLWRPTKGKGGRPRRTDDDLKAAVKVYNREWAQPGRPAPTRAVAEWMAKGQGQGRGKGHWRTYYSTAASWVMEARRRGFLPPTAPGKAAGSDPTREQAK